MTENYGAALHGPTQVRARLGGLAPARRNKNEYKITVLQYMFFMYVCHLQCTCMSGANLNATSTDGDTALILATTYACCTVKGADPGLLDLLACRGVNVNAQNCNGDSPLSIAALHGRTELLSILLQYGKKNYP